MVPTVSVGLPVYNGERYLGGAIDAILAQGFEDFELIISDNGSTDSTEEICREYARADARVQFFREERNRGLAWNFNRVVELASAPLFKWFSADDLCHPDLLERSAEAMEAIDSQVVLCYPRTLIIDESGEPTRHYEDRLDLRQTRPSQRLAALMSNLRRCNPIFGLMRRERLLESRLMGGYPAADRVLLAELAMIGQFHELPDELFYRRLHPGGSTFANTSVESRRRFWDTSRNGDLFALPMWRLAAEHLRGVRGVPLPAREQRACYATVVRYYAVENRRLLVNDGRRFAKRLLTASGVMSRSA
jgi:glycosyltransferase involved in cell wall biosynthesis